ncbi:hypothetical protein BJ508DRAFT_124516 [Ascobolus immersus RN42]|uniref:DUF6697 domain-containing protein n=1 Tax=Ascobolus immersus RN42 TaxID=1160509 RepID=A0A3N4I3J6_ASCIM|nr:hypothetical protein BJ508DRAFT_124516 [Ascobolus immersus RN42]
MDLSLNPAWNPDLPSSPNTHGIILLESTRPLIPFSQTVPWPLFVYRSSSNWQYMGHYTATYLAVLTASEFRVLPDKVKDTWANGLSTLVWGRGVIERHVGRDSVTSSKEKAREYMEEGLVRVVAVGMKACGFDRELYRKLESELQKERSMEKDCDMEKSKSPVVTTSKRRARPPRFVRAGTSAEKPIEILDTPPASPLRRRARSPVASFEQTRSPSLSPLTSPERSLSPSPVFEALDSITLSLTSARTRRSPIMSSRSRASAASMASMGVPFTPIPFGMPVMRFPKNRFENETASTSRVETTPGPPPSPAQPVQTKPSLIVKLRMSPSTSLQDCSQTDRVFAPPSLVKNTSGLNELSSPSPPSRVSTHSPKHSFSSAPISSAPDASNGSSPARIMEEHISRPRLVVKLKVGQVATVKTEVKYEEDVEFKKEVKAEV